jgi:hypothetical protein
MVITDHLHDEVIQDEEDLHQDDDHQVQADGMMKIYLFEEKFLIWKGLVQLNDLHILMN